MTNFVKKPGRALALCLAASSFTLGMAPVQTARAQDAEQTQAAWRVPSDEAIRALLAERMAENGVGIVIGIAGPDGRRLLTHGRSGAENQRPLGGDTVFQIGSVTKVFTTLLLADMAARGDVRLDDPAQLYLPAGVTMPRREGAREITLADLATHMSGLPSMPTNYDLTAPDPYAAYSTGDLHDFLNAHAPERAPGEAYAYSNLGVSLLGRMLAARAGGAYEDVLRERVLAPLGLASTSINLSPEQQARLAPGHDRTLTPVTTWEMASLQGSGSLRSTANDLMRALEAFLGFTDTPLAEAMALQQSAVRQPIPGGEQLLGLSARTLNGVTIVGHDGGKEGYRSALMFNPATRTGVVVLANARTDDTPIEIAAWLMTGRDMGPIPAVPARGDHVLTEAELDAFAGDYAMADGALLRVARAGDHIVLDRPGEGVIPLYATGPAAFEGNTTGESLSFTIDAEGRASAVTLGEGEDARTANRIG